MAATSATLVNTIATQAGVPAGARAIRIASVLLMTALTAAAAQVSIPLPFTPVPFTLQPMVVLLSGLVLGARLGAASQALYLALGIIGLPVFAIAPTLAPGALRLLGPTGGYLMAYPFAAFMTGWLADRGFDRRYFTSVLAMGAGLILIYAFGSLWLGIFARTVAGSAPVGVGAALASGVYPFILPDLIKLLAAAGVVPGLWRLVGRSGS